MKFLKITFYTFLLFTLPYLFVSCNSSSKKNDKNPENYTYYQDQGEIFHTSYHIKYAYQRSLHDEIKKELVKVDHSLNPFDENSIISKVNRNEPVELDSFFVDVFNKAMEVSIISEGKFDVTASPFFNVWGFGFEKREEVSPQTIDSLKQFVGYQKIKLENGKIVKTDPRIQLNTTSLTDGYASDVIGRLLESYGIENYMVEIGGEVAAKGVNDKQECWRIGIDKPIDDNTGMHQELQTIVSVCDKCISTSGNYRNYYIKNGKKYAHSIDPITGYPSENEMLGATVIADDCMTADAYSTAFMVAGLKKSEEMAKKVPGLFYYLIYSTPDQKIATVYSEGFEQFFADKTEILEQNP
jgi:thiamine biosynthesis lipoprotein